MTLFPYDAVIKNFIWCLLRQDYIYELNEVKKT